MSRLTRFLYRENVTNKIDMLSMSLLNIYKLQKKKIDVNLTIIKTEFSYSN